MRTLPAILLALRVLTAQANPVKSNPEARSVDLLTWLEAADWANPNVDGNPDSSPKAPKEKGSNKDKPEPTKDDKKKNKNPTPEHKRDKDKNKQLGAALDKVLTESAANREGNSVAGTPVKAPPPSDNKPQGEPPKIKKRQIIDLISWDSARTAGGWAWPYVEPFLQQFINKLTQASQSALETDKEIDSLVEAAGFVTGNDNPVDQKKRKRDTNSLHKRNDEKEATRGEMYRQEDGSDKLKQLEAEEEKEHGEAEKLRKRDGDGSQKLRKRYDYSSFLPISDLMDFDEPTRQKIRLLYETETIMSHVEEIVLSAYFFAKFMAARVPDCAKTEFARWVNATARNSSNTMNIPTTNSNGQESIIQVNLDQPAVLNPNQGSKKIKRDTEKITKRESGTDAFGNAAASSVLEATRQLFLDIKKMVDQIDRKVKLGNPRWAGMSSDAEFVYESYLTDMVADRMRIVLERNMTDVNKKVLAAQVKQLVGESDALDLGAELINIAAKDNSNNPYALNSQQAAAVVNQYTSQIINSIATTSTTTSTQLTTSGYTSISTTTSTTASISTTTSTTSTISTTTSTSTSTSTTTTSTTSTSTTNTRTPSTIVTASTATLVVQRRSA